MLFSTLLISLTSFSYYSSKFIEGEVNLTNGGTYYKKIEVEKGQPYLVFVHGGTVSCSLGSFDQYMAELSQKGQNVLCFDAYGSGKSSPWLERAQFQQKDLEDQLKELLEKLPETKGHKNTIVGSSAGACTTARFTVSHPDKVNKVGFISPAIDVMSTKSTKDRFGIWLFRQFPKSKMFHGMLKKTIQRRTKEVVQECPQEVQSYIGQAIDTAVQDEQFVANFYRKVIGNVFADCSDAFEQVAKVDVPIFAASGAKDNEVPIEVFRGVFKDRVKEDDTYLEFSEAGHGLQCRESQKLIREIAQFIGKEPRVPTLRQPASASR